MVGDPIAEGGCAVTGEGRYLLNISREGRVLTINIPM